MKMFRNVCLTLLTYNLDNCTDCSFVKLNFINIYKTLKKSSNHSNWKLNNFKSKLTETISPTKYFRNLINTYARRLRNLWSAIKMPCGVHKHIRRRGKAEKNINTECVYIIHSFFCDKSGALINEINKLSLLCRRSVSRPLCRWHESFMRSLQTANGRHERS